MNKCDKCNKNIIKTSPGIECLQCDKIVHIATACSGLNNKQRAALRANDNLGWTCEDCKQESPKRRSVLVPEDDEDNEDPSEKLTSTAAIDVKKLVRDITLQMEKAMKREIGELTQSLEFHTSKMDEMVEAVEAFKSSVHELSRKNSELVNKTNHLQTRVGALEQRVLELEQERLNCTLIIANVPEEETEKPKELVTTIAAKLKLEHDGVIKAKRIFRKDKPGPIQVTLETETDLNNWIQKAKSTRITVNDLLSTPTTAEEDRPIFIREALTPYTSKLLWMAKKELKEKFKFIWCKKGVIRAKKEEKSDSYIIRSEGDVKKLSAK